jgi:hypothetical protein
MRHLRRGQPSGSAINADLKPPQAAVVKATVITLRKSRTRNSIGVSERGEREQTAGELSKADEPPWSAGPAGGMKRWGAILADKTCRMPELLKRQPA